MSRNKKLEQRLLSLAKQPLLRSQDRISAEKIRADFAAQIAERRRLGIDRWYREGGYWFIAWVKQHYKRWSGEALRWSEPYLEEYYLIMGTPHIERIIVEKPSQVGFSESLIAMAAFLLAEIRIPIAMGFEREMKLRDIVSPRIQPAFDFILPIVQARKERWEATHRKDTDFQQRKLTVSGVELTFFYTSTATKQKDERQASSAMSSFTAWVVLGDEIELWAKGSLDVATERQSACEMPTKPFRAGSTPGQEGGIVDAQVKQSGYVFEWTVLCPHCQALQAIDAFGNLLKPVQQEGDDGTSETRFVDLIGRPLDWFCHDQSSQAKRIETAYVGCQICSKELGWEAIAGGHFQSKTGIKLREFCNDLIENQKYVFIPVALRLPRLASVLFSPSERIRKLLTTSNPGDQLQQGLGKAISVGGGKISLPRLLKCVTAIAPARNPDLIALGVDQGRSANWGIVQRWWLGDEGDWEQRWMNAFKEIIWYGEITGFHGIDELVARYDVDLVGIDNEPEVQLAAAYARKHLPYGTEVIDEVFADTEEQLDDTMRSARQQGQIRLSENTKGQVYLFDQVMLKGEDFRRSERIVQRIRVPIYSIHRSFGLDAVRNRIYRGLQKLPSDCTYQAGEEYNLMYHYLTSDRRNDGTWAEIPNTPDHWFHADSFCECAILISHYETSETGFYFGSLSRS